MHTVFVALVIFRFFECFIHLLRGLIEEGEATAWNRNLVRNSVRDNFKWHLICKNSAIFNSIKGSSVVWNGVVARLHHRKSLNLFLCLGT